MQKIFYLLLCLLFSKTIISQEIDYYIPIAITISDNPDLLDSQKQIFQLSFEEEIPETFFTDDIVTFDLNIYNLSSYPRPRLKIEYAPCYECDQRRGGSLRPIIIEPCDEVVILSGDDECDSYHHHLFRGETLNLKQLGFNDLQLNLSYFDQRKSQFITVAQKIELFQVLPIPPDLKATQKYAHITSGASSNNIKLSATTLIKNTSKVSTNETSIINYYASKDAVFDPSDILLTKRQIPEMKGNQEITVSIGQQIFIPPYYDDIPNNFCYLIAFIDPENLILEKDETNNIDSFHLCSESDDYHGNQILVYPNPIESYVYVESKSTDINEVITLEVYNTKGILIYNSTLLPFHSEKEKNIYRSENPNLSRGLYHYRFQIGKNVIHKTLVKK
ncbi:T9SS type A sorting domain-containing protein [uncultured Aquimarina sp.]|uniref:T9SS type A sorting domain-containing protein n=1 Tax=uncultured Aquimarina sp. TaxID=575652 RepID=UPI0026277C22|nr:T9SS type A sorting domain-containing protein [uncultured Aquimarina sp.]